MGVPEQTKRNRRIYKDKLKGITFTQLIRKYNLSLNRLQFIVKREKERAVQHKRAA